jgi:hypothetical protein
VVKFYKVDDATNKWILMFKRKEMDLSTDYTLFRGDELPEVVRNFLRENKIILPDEKILFCMCDSDYKDLILLSTNERVIHYFKVGDDKKIESVYWKDINSINFDYFMSKIIITVYGGDTINMKFGKSQLRDFFDELMIEWKKMKKRKGEGEKVENPIEIIKRRYSKGEITKEEFEEMKKEFA